MPLAEGGGSGGNASQSHSGRGVRKGSSGGCCRIVGKDPRETKDLNEGVPTTHSRDRLGSTRAMVVLGVCPARVSCSIRECLADLGRPNENAAKADCCLRK